MKDKKLEENNNLIRKVGRCYEDPKNPFNYMKVKFDDDKWADASKFLPGDFDLCYCKIRDEKKILPGWHTGFCWDGSNIKPKHEILFWKLNYDT